MNLEIIQTKIYEFRSRKVMLDFDLAELYQVETRRLNEAVKRNIKRFPEDFMFQINTVEWEILMSQIATSRWGGTRKLPHVFTEQGVAMLSGLLNSEVAINVNIAIMRAFVALRQHALNYTEINQKLDAFMADTNMQFYEVYQVLTELAEQKRESEKPRRPIGFRRSE